MSRAEADSADGRPFGVPHSARNPTSCVAVGTPGNERGGAKGGATGLEPRTEPWEMALELCFLSFGVVTRVLRFLRICVGALRDVTVLDRLVWRLNARG